MEKQMYDVVVIGAGSGGLTAAVGFSKVGKKVLLVEREHMGGECTNTGCVPSKALLHHAKKYHEAIETVGAGPKSEAFRTDAFTYVRSKIDAILAEEKPEDFEALGITVVSGTARFSGRCSVCVDHQDTTTEYHFKKAVIASGSSPRPIEIDGLNDGDILTNQNVFDLKEVPERLLVIGAGPIGMELGQAFQMLGSQVTIATIDQQFARLEPAPIGAVIEQKFTDLGIEILKEAHVQKVENGSAIFDLKENGTVKNRVRVPFDKVLVAIGRIPNIPEGLDECGIKHTKYGITTNTHHRTSNKDVYAVGDAALRLKFTHTADDAARHVVQHTLTRGWLAGRTQAHKAVPKVTYTSPEIAAVGMTCEESYAKYKESEVMCIEVPYSHNDRAKTDSATEGLMIVNVRRISGAVLGAHIIGPGAGEMISIFTLAIDRKISMWKLRNLIYPYPTYSLLIKKAGDQFFSRQIADVKTDLKNLAKKHATKIFALAFWAGLISAFVWYKGEYSVTNLQLLEMFYHFITGSLWGPVIYMVAYAIRPLIFFPATLLTALSGALFGPIYGILYTIVGENASANLAYWIGRFFGQDLKLEDSIIGNWVQALRKNPFISVLFMRLFYVPFDLTNYGSGIVRVPWSSYALATVIGILPGLATFVVLGASIDISKLMTDGISFNAFDIRFIGLSVGIFIASIVLARFLKKWQPQS